MVFTRSVVLVDKDPSVNSSLFHPVVNLLNQIFSCVYMCAKSIQLCPTLCDTMDQHSLPGSSVHGILQARILVWVALHASKASSPPRDGTHVSYVSCLGREVLHH